MRKGIDFIGVGTGALVFNSDAKVLIAQRGHKANNEQQNGISLELRLNLVKKLRTASKEIPIIIVVQAHFLEIRSLLLVPFQNFGCY